MTRPTTAGSHLQAFAHTSRPPSKSAAARRRTGRPGPGFLPHSPLPVGNSRGSHAEAPEGKQNPCRPARLAAGEQVCLCRARNRRAGGGGTMTRGEFSSWTFPASDPPTRRESRQGGRALPPLQERKSNVNTFKKKELFCPLLFSSLLKCEAIRPKSNFLSCPLEWPHLHNGTLPNWTAASKENGRPKKAMNPRRPRSPARKPQPEQFCRRQEGWIGVASHGIVRYGEWPTGERGTLAAYRLNWHPQTRRHLFRPELSSSLCHYRQNILFIAGVFLR